MYSTILPCNECMYHSLCSVPFRRPDPLNLYDESPLPVTRVASDHLGLRLPDCIDDSTQRVIVEGIRRQAKVGTTRTQTTGHAPSDMDLLGSMATRLTQVERELLAAKREIVNKVRD